MTIKETRLYVFNRDNWHCVVCGKKTDWSTGQLAHRIPKTKYNLKTYGDRIINHPMNLRLTCSLKCNDAVLIGGKPIEKEQLLYAIKNTLQMNNTKGGIK